MKWLIDPHLSTAAPVAVKFARDFVSQFDVGQVETLRKLNGQELLVPAAGANPDKVIQDNPRKDMVFRTQIQFQF